MVSPLIAFLQHLLLVHHVISLTQFPHSTPGPVGPSFHATPIILPDCILNTSTIHNSRIYISVRIVGTLTPDGQIWVDCGSKHTFTCSVSHITTGASSAGRTITLDGIAATEDSGKEAESMYSSRISTSDTSGFTKSSTITITGFIESDNGGTIRCINLDDGSVQGMASI